MKATPKHTLPKRSIHSDAGQAVIKDRAKKLSVVEEKRDNRAMQTYLQVRVGGDEIYGLSYQHLEEILQDVKITPVPCRNDAIIGVINWRGRILSIIDLTKMFNLESKNQYTNTWISVINIDNKYIGCLVDDVLGDSQYIEEDLDRSLSTNLQIEGDFVLGVCEGQIAILNLVSIYDACVSDKDEGK